MEKVQIDSKFADKQGEIMVVELGGHIDQSNSYQLQKMFDNIIHSGCYKVVVDFGRLFYMSSAGWGVFIGEIKRFRDNGGDIKLANMNPDIYDVYQMLEFYHILEDYVSVQEAALSFKNQSDELDLVVGPELVNNKNNNNNTLDLNDKKTEKVKFEIESDTISDKETNEKDVTLIDFIPSQSNLNGMVYNKNNKLAQTFKQDVKLSELPLSEKIKKIVAENPLIGVLGIRKVLKHEHFGYTHVGIIKLWRTLKDLNLDSKTKRYRYYRSS